MPRSQLDCRSWSFLEIADAQPGEMIITDHQIVRSLALLKLYASADACRCRTDEGNDTNQCQRCSALTLIGEVLVEML